MFFARFSPFLKFFSGRRKTSLYMVSPVFWKSSNHVGLFRGMVILAFLPVTLRYPMIEKKIRKRARSWPSRTVKTQHTEKTNVARTELICWIVRCHTSQRNPHSDPTFHFRDMAEKDALPDLTEWEWQHSNLVTIRRYLVFFAIFWKNDWFNDRLSRCCPTSEEIHL